MALNKGFLWKARPELSQEKIDSIVRQALIEDIGKGDITSQLTIAEDKEINALILVKEDCLVCGLKVAERAFKISDGAVSFKPLAREGQAVKKGKAIARLTGRARGILAAERVALNLLSMLSGIATKTRGYVKEIRPYKAKITDTRKTIPGLRELQKYAVRIGGGYSHRMGLDEMLLIKDNHLKVTQGYEKLPSVPKGFKIEIEAQDLKEFEHALKFKPNAIMLDNMGIQEIKEAVKIRNATVFDSHHPRTQLEASGGLDLENVRKIAACGVDIISVGALTHSPESIDISLEVL